jgi:hypothetical protein
MSLFRSLTLPVVRSGPGEYIQGRWVDGLSETLTAYGTACGLPVEKLLKLPEGDQFGGGIELIVDLPLHTLDDGLGRKADLIEYDGRFWEVVSASYFNNGVIPHCEAIAVWRRSSHAAN